MKVLYINTNCSAGSTGRIVSSLYKTVVNDGGEAKVAYIHGYPGTVSNEDTYIVEGRAEYYVHNFMSRLFDRAGFYSSKATNKLVSYIRDYNPDIIHLHNLHGYYINLPILFDYLRKSNVPVVWTLHDFWAFTGHCSCPSFINCNKWMTMCNKCPQIRSYPKSYFVDNSSKNYLDKYHLIRSLSTLFLVTPSKWLAGEVSKSFLGSFPISYIYNGIDLDVFKRTQNDIKIKYGIPHYKRIILGVAFVWSKEKGLYDFIKLDTLIDHDIYQIVLVGVDNYIKTLLPHTIISIERTNNIEELVDLYSNAYVFVNPSYQETMGMVTAEAIACGTPAIVYDQTAVPEIVDVNSGIVVKASDVITIAQSLNKMEEYLPEQVVKRAKAFDKNKQYNKYLDLYHRILKEKTLSV